MRISYKFWNLIQNLFKALPFTSSLWHLTDMERQKFSERTTASLESCLSQKKQTLFSYLCKTHETQPFHVLLGRISTPLALCKNKSFVPVGKTKDCVLSLQRQTFYALLFKPNIVSRSFPWFKVLEITRGRGWRWRDAGATFWDKLWSYMLSSRKGLLSCIITKRIHISKLSESFRD